MKLEIRVPEIGESINEVTVATILIQSGEYAEMDDALCEFDTDKATLEFPAEKAGSIEWVVEEGDDLKIGDLLGYLDTDAKAPEVKKAPVETAAPVKETKAETKKESPATAQKSSAAPAKTSHATGHASPAAAKMMAENNITSGQIAGTGVGGRITKGDVIAALKNGVPAATIMEAGKINSRGSSRKKMSRLRKTVSRRLVAVKNETAMLTTFNEVNMKAVMDIRSKYKAKFEKKHGIRLGFMSFFLKACANALMEFPQVNGYLDDSEIILHEYADISIAVSTPKGLVVPVIRNAESKGMMELEGAVRELAVKGRDGDLTLEEMQGGTFTITNGGGFWFINVDTNHKCSSKRNFRNA